MRTSDYQQISPEEDKVSEFRRKIMNTLNFNKNIVEICGGQYGDDLSYNNFYPYEFVDGTVEEAKTFVCFDMEYSAYEPIKEVFNRFAIYFYIASHKSIIRSSNGLKTDLITHEIKKTYDGKDILGISRMHVIANRIYLMSQNFRGRVLVIETDTFRY